MCISWVPSLIIPNNVQSVLLFFWQPISMSGKISTKKNELGEWLLAAPF